MYLQRRYRKRGGGKHESWALVDSVRTVKGPSSSKDCSYDWQAPWSVQRGESWIGKDRTDTGWETKIRQGTV
jgi:hypothetical protein